MYTYVIGGKRPVAGDIRLKEVTKHRHFLNNDVIYIYFPETRTEISKNPSNLRIKKLVDERDDAFVYVKETIKDGELDIILRFCVFAFSIEKSQYHRHNVFGNKDQ
ncbi:hypothetical protein DPMN_141096 [Dreissena polymorpha]|uniref:Uncharacterized protein n=1 Tax=Dreissena polymorpha TaxID=45954 RepID=A0A9D4JJK8_DREPO|nr:hypothetical protein DPMN_141096 [Dreissena polymorpha]